MALAGDLVKLLASSENVFLITSLEVTRTIVVADANIAIIHFFPLILDSKPSAPPKEKDTPTYLPTFLHAPFEPNERDHDLDQAYDVRMFPKSLPSHL